MATRSRLNVAEYGVATIGREEFLDEYWDYTAGEHVTVLAPTGGGKTHLLYQLLGETADPELQATVLVMKPRDETVVKFSKKYGFRIVRDWPPAKVTAIAKKPAGYVLWPKESNDPEYDDRRHSIIFQRAIRDNYRKGNRITVGDEVYSLESELKLSKELVRVWTKGRSMDNGLWAASQRPAYISRWAYQAHHLFLGNDPDLETQKRYGEIGAGINPDLVRALTAKLSRYQFVYIQRDDRRICIVDQ
jgi:hypothetical protein